MSNNLTQNGKISWGGAMGIASTWFGLHCGAGFATGAQGVVYYTKFGAWAFITPFIAALLMSFYAYNLWNFARVFETYNYRDTYNKLFEPYDKVFATIQEISYLIILVMAMGGVLSGAASLLEQVFGFNYVLGSLSISLVIFLLTIFGSEFLKKASSLLSTILIVALLVVNIAGIIAAGPKIANIFTNWDTSVSFLDALVPAIIYAMFQSAVMCGTVSLASGLKSEKDTKIAGVIGFVLNGGIMWLVAIMMLGYYPGVIGEPLPVLSILQQLDNPIYLVAYNTSLGVAFITTGITLVFSLVARFEKYGANIVAKVETRRKILSILVIMITFAISLVGLLAIIGKGYSFVGYIALPFIYIPTVIIAPIKIKKRRESLKTNI